MILNEKMKKNILIERIEKKLLVIEKKGEKYKEIVKSVKNILNNKNKLTLYEVIQTYLPLFYRTLEHENQLKPFGVDINDAIRTLHINKINDEKHFYLFSIAVEFTEWLGLKVKTNKEIPNKKEYPEEKKEMTLYFFRVRNSFNTIFEKCNINKENKISLLAFFYLSFIEYLKNTMKEDLASSFNKKDGKIYIKELFEKLDEFYNSINETENDKQFKSILKELCSDENKELRNSIAHADFIIQNDKIIYEKRDKSKLEITYDKLKEQTISFFIFTGFVLYSRWILGWERYNA